MATEEFDLEAGGGIPDFLRDPTGIPGRHWRWMTLAFVLGSAATGFMFWNWEPVYRAHSSILVTSQQIPEKFVQTTVIESPFSRLNAMVSQVLSRPKLVALIDEFSLFSGLKDSLPLEEIVTLMRGKIVIEAQGGRRAAKAEVTARVYMISYEDREPQRAAAVTNRLAGLFLEAGIRSRIERADEISRFLRQELHRSDDVLREQNRAIGEFNEMYRGELPSELATNLGKLDRLQREKQSVELQIIETETRLATMPVLQDPNTPEARLAALRQRYAEEIAIRTPEHPSVIAISRRIEAVEAQITAGDASGRPLQSRSAKLAAAQAGLATLRAQLARLTREAVEIDGRVARTPKHQEALAELSEKAGVSREKYLDFLRKVNAAELAQILEAQQQGSQVSIMDRAFPPRLPERSRLRLMLLGVLGTLGATGAAGLLFELLDPVLVAADQIELLTGLPELGSVSHLG
jgi:uncharacterized protein involved in exopolysaccharide biosynthesis